MTAVAGLMLSVEEEDHILDLAERIQREHYLRAEKTWKETPQDERRRAWSRCHDVTCNREVTCKGPGCKGFDF